MSDEVFGQQELATGNSEFNQMSFLVKQMLNKLNVATMVQVVAVNPTPNNTAQAVGTVDVLPLVGQVDGGGKIWPGTTLFGLPYFRLQAGAAALLIDPAVGDIGFVIFCDKDISSVKSSGGASGPGSARRFDMADGFYLGGWMSATVPTNYVQINGTQIELAVGAVTAVMNASGITTTVGGTSLVQNASGFTLNGSLQVNGAVTTNSTITAGGEVKFGSHTLSQHTHTTVANLGTPSTPVN